MRKDIGWFDDKEHAPGIISSTMASDTQTINGVCSSGLASQIESMFSLLCALGLGMYYSW